MPAVIALFIRMIGLSIIPLGWKLLRGLGFAAVSYVGISAALDGLKDLAISKLGSVPATWINVLGLLQIDVVLSITFSALAARAILRGVDKAGKLDTFRWGAPK